MISNNSKILGLRPIEREDLFIIQKWRNNKLIQPFVREYRELGQKNIEKWYDSIIHNNRFEFFLIQDNSNIPIGVTGLTYIDWVNKNADIHLAIYEHDWIDEIYAPEVLNIMIDYGFNHLNLHRIYAEVYEVDLKKINFLKKNKFKRDAILREHHFYNGAYIDSHVYSILNKN